jgi:hypothetical protein
MLWFVYQAWKGKYSSWMWVGLVFSILIQLHYITLIMGAFAGLIWVYQCILVIRGKKNGLAFFGSTAIAIGIFAVSLTPLVLFDMRHGHINQLAFESFFTHGSDHFLFLSAIRNLSVSSVTLFVRNFLALFRVSATGFTKFVVFVVLFALCVWSMVKKKNAFRIGQRLLLTFLLFSCCFLSLYRLTIFDHYLGFLYPVSVLLLGMILSHMWDMKILRVCAGIFLVVCVVFSLANTPFKENLGYNIDMMKRTADAIQSHVTPGQQYNIFLYSPSLDFQGMNYRYFLTTGKQAPVSEDEFFTFPTLFVIDDLHKEDIFDTHHYMFAIWPNKNIVEKFSIPGGPGVSVIRR